MDAETIWVLQDVAPFPAVLLGRDGAILAVHALGDGRDFAKVVYGQRPVALLLAQGLNGELITGVIDPDPLLSEVIAFPVENGEPVWRAPGVLTAAPVVDAAGNSFTGLADGALTKRDSVGTVLWSIDVGGRVRDLALSDDGLVYAAHDDGVDAVEAATGVLRRRYLQVDPVGIVLDRARLWVVSANLLVSYAASGTGLDAAALWPAFLHDNQRTSSPTLPAHVTQVRARCGDGLVEAGEACDDGNDLLADGCYACAAVVDAADANADFDDAPASPRIEFGVLGASGGFTSFSAQQELFEAGSNLFAWQEATAPNNVVKNKGADVLRGPTFFRAARDVVVTAGDEPTAVRFSAGEAGRHGVSVHAECAGGGCDAHVSVIIGGTTVARGELVSTSERATGFLFDDVRVLDANALVDVVVASPGGDPVDDRVLLRASFGRLGP